MTNIQEPNPASTEPPPGLLVLLAVMYRQRVQVTLIVSACLVLSLVAFWLQKPLYTTRMVVLFPPTLDSGALISGVLGGGGDLEDSIYESMPGVLPRARRPTIVFVTSVLQSRAIATKIAKKFDLAKVWGTSDFKAVRRLQKRLKHYAIKADGWMEVSLEMEDPKLAKSILEAYLSEYYALMSESSLFRAKKERLFVESQVKLALTELKRAEFELVEFQKANGIEVLESDLEVGAQLLSALNQAKVEATASLSKAQAERDSLREGLLKSASAAQANPAAPVPGSDSVLTDLQAELVSARLELDDLRHGRKDEHPEVKLARARFDDISREFQGRLDTLHRGYQANLTQDLLRKSVQLSGVEAQLSAVEDYRSQVDSKARKQASKAVTFQLLKKEFEGKLTEVKMLELELLRSRITESRETVELEIIDPPFVPEQPTSPNLILHLVLGVCLGLGISLAYTHWSGVWRGLQQIELD